MTEWDGWRITLNCGHHYLAGRGFDKRIGQLAACYCCPLVRTEGERSVSPMRQVVDKAMVSASQEPETWPSEWWYGT